MNTVKKKFSFVDFAGKNILLVVLLVMVIAMVFVNKNFLTLSNLINVLRNMAVTGIMACAMTMMMVGGEFDLSFGSTLGLTTCIIPLLTENLSAAGMSVTAGALIGILIAFVAATLVGCINAYFVVKWRLPAILVTLAVQFTVYGVAGTITGGYPQYTLPEWFAFFGKGTIGGKVPYSIVIFLVVFVLFYIIMSHTKFGRTMYVVGGNAEAARLSGISTKKYKAWIFIVMQWAACLAGIIFASQLAGGTQAYGRGTEFNVIAGVIIGGTGLAGGRGTMRGTFIGMLFLNIIMNAMTIANLSEYLQYIVRGIIMLAAILLSEAQGIWANKKRIKSAQQLQEMMQE